MRRLLVVALAVVLVGLVGLVGCSAEGPKADPAPEPSASESVVPKDETAEEFIRRWFQVQEDMQNSGDTTGYLAMAPDCVSCKKVAATITDVYSAGGTVDYGGHQVVKVKSRGTTPETFDVRLEVEATMYSPRAGAPTETLRGGTDNYAVTVAKPEGIWLVTHLYATSG